MNGLLVVGDVRLHSVVFEREQDQGASGSEPASEFGMKKQRVDSWIYGGAYMMADLIHLSLFDLERASKPGRKRGTATKPLLLSYSPPDSEDDPEWWDYSWELAPSGQNDRRALKEPLKTYWNRPKDWVPLFPDENKKGLFCRELFDTVSEDSPLKSNGLPRKRAIKFDRVDLLVIDDLDKCFRKWTGDDESICKKMLNHVFTAFEKKLKDKNSPKLQPLVLICFKGLPPTTQADDLKNSNEQEGKTYWRRILDNDELCKRTVVVLDSDYLRRAGFDVSEALSWEQTAQDFIDELQKNERLQDIRKIGHLIVRFGASGVLYVRREQNDWLSRLFFFPDRDDRWHARTDDGVILGYGAILTAALVRSLWRFCDEADGKPPRERLPEAMEDGLMHGLRACNYMCLTG